MYWYHLLRSNKYLGKHVCSNLEFYDRDRDAFQCEVTRPRPDLQILKSLQPNCCSCTLCSQSKVAYQ